MTLMTLVRSGESSRPLDGTRRSTTTIAQLRDITMFACRTSPGAVPAFSSRSWSLIQVVGTQCSQHWRDVPTIRNDKRSRIRHLSVHGSMSSDQRPELPRISCAHTDIRQPAHLAASVIRPTNCRGGKRVRIRASVDSAVPTDDVRRETPGGERRIDAGNALLAATSAVVVQEPCTEVVRSSNRRHRQNRSDRCPQRRAVRAW